MTTTATKKQRFRLKQRAPEGYLTVKETAALLGVSTRTIHRYITLYGLPAAKPAGIWFIRKEDLERWMRANG